MSTIALPDTNTSDFTVAGDLISSNAESTLKEICARLESIQGPGPFTLDLSKARMIDSAGLNAVVAVFKRTEKLGRKMRIIYSNANIQRILVFTRLDQHIELLKK